MAKETIEKNFHRRDVSDDFWALCSDKWDGMIEAGTSLAGGLELSAPVARAAAFGPRMTFAGERKSRVIVHKDGTVITLAHTMLDMPEVNYVNFDFSAGDFVMLHVLNWMGATYPMSDIINLLFKYNVAMTTGSYL